MTLRARILSCISSLAPGSETAADELRACAEIAGAMEWQPIETAPKDGTLVLLRNAQFGANPLPFWWDLQKRAWRKGGWLQWWFEDSLGPTQWSLPPSSIRASEATSVNTSRSEPGHGHRAATAGAGDDAGVTEAMVPLRAVLKVCEKYLEAEGGEVWIVNRIMDDLHSVRARGARHGE